MVVYRAGSSEPTPVKAAGCRKCQGCGMVAKPNGIVVTADLKRIYGVCRCGECGGTGRAT